MDSELLLVRPETVPAIRGLVLQEIHFVTDLHQPLWEPVAVPVGERAAGSPLAPDEVIQMELEDDQGKVIWWIGRLDGTRRANSRRYPSHRLTVRCDQGDPEALRAIQTFLNGSWLQQDETYLAALMELASGGSVNLREEGHVVRDGDRGYLWADTAAFRPDPQVQVVWSEWVALLALNRQFLRLRRKVDEAVSTARTEADLPGDLDLPRYHIGRGFQGEDRWKDA